jgi:hypothetical protein
MCRRSQSSREKECVVVKGKRSSDSQRERLVFEGWKERNAGIILPLIHYRWVPGPARIVIVYYFWVLWLGSQERAVSCWLDFAQVALSWIFLCARLWLFCVSFLAAVIITKAIASMQHEVYIPIWAQKSCSVPKTSKNSRRS